MVNLMVAGLRLRRAQEHINALSDMAHEFWTTKPYSVLTEPNADRSEYAFRLKIHHEPPVELGLVISDAIHNLRGALNSLVFDLAGRPGNERIATELDFPLVTKGGRRQFDRTAKKKLAGVHPDAVAVIERAQPYRRLSEVIAGVRTYNPLRILRDLSNVDKHRTLHFGGFRQSEFGVHCSVLPTEQYVAEAGNALDDGAIIARYGFDEPNVQVKGPAVSLELTVVIPRHTPIPINFYLMWIAQIIEVRIFQRLP